MFVHFDYRAFSYLEMSTSKTRSVGKKKKNPPDNSGNRRQYASDTYRIMIKYYDHLSVGA